MKAREYSQAQRELLELTGIRVWTSSSPADSSDNAGSEGMPWERGLPALDEGKMPSLPAFPANKVLAW